MRKLLVFQHAAHEILGTLNPLLKHRGLRIRYVNFNRDPEARPELDRYDGIIVLGGHMGVYEADKYTHIKVELELIEKALSKNIPVLGICLGAQLLAQVLGAEVRRHVQPEIGWCKIELTDDGRQDSLIGHFKENERVFQIHGDTFEIPKSAEHLARSELCEGQAFRYKERAYGIQFHLEADRPMIERWLTNPAHFQMLKGSMELTAEDILRETEAYLKRSNELSHVMFDKFIDLFGPIERHIILGSEHGKPRKK